MSRFRFQNLLSFRKNQILLSSIKILLILFLIGSILANGECLMCLSPRVVVEALVQPFNGYNRTYIAKIESQSTTALHDSSLHFDLYTTTDHPPALTVNYKFVPPQGARNFSFSGIQPKTSQPPFIWEQVGFDVSGKGWVASLSFDLPDLVDGQKAVSSFIVYDDNGQTLAHSIQIATNQTVTENSFVEPALPSETSDAIQSPENGYSIWNLMTYFDTKEVTMTTKLCQDWVDALQSGNIFAAIQAPAYSPTITPTAAATDTFMLPLSFEENETLNIKQYARYYLRDISNPPFYEDIIDIKPEVKSERMDFVTNALPASPGEIWVPLGLPTSPALTCPEGLNLPPEDWIILGNTYLDLGGVVTTHHGEVIDVYYCYEGQENPFSSSDEFVLPVLSSLNLEIPLTNYDDWNVTCIGPQLWQLLDKSASLKLLYMNVAHVEPTETISVYHRIDVTSDMSITIDIDSPWVVSWKMYGGTQDAPDLGDPLTSPFFVDDVQHLWLFADVPAETADGSYTLKVSASPVLFPTPPASISDLIWVGEWVPPAYTPSKPIYLPLINR
jgi:hypothetical protein